MKAKLNYIVINEHPKNLPHHQPVFEKLDASMVRKSSMKAHESHCSSLLVASE